MKSCVFLILIVKSLRYQNLKSVDIRSKIKSKEIKTKDDMIKFVRTENQRYEQSQKEIPKKIQDFEGISFVSIIFLFLIIFTKLFKSKKAS